MSRFPVRLTFLVVRVSITVAGLGPISKEGSNILQEFFIK